MFAGQVFVNMGASSGLLPTKGLTLPFVSYGGSSLIMNCVLLGIVLRIAQQLRGDSTSTVASSRKVAT
jgi:cell division protein FtsW